MNQMQLSFQRKKYIACRNMNMKLIFKFNFLLPIVTTILSIGNIHALFIWKNVVVQ
jgi:hypothetical protein